MYLFLKYQSLGTIVKTNCLAKWSYVLIKWGKNEEAFVGKALYDVFLVFPSENITC